MFNNLLATSGWQSYILIIALAVVLILMFVLNSRQRKKQQQEAEKKMNALSVGDSIKTIGMIMGEVVELPDDNTVVIKTGNANNFSYVRFDKQAIYQIFKAEANEPFSNDGYSTVETEASETAENVDESVEENNAANETVETENTVVEAEKNESEREFH